MSQTSKAQPYVENGVIHNLPVKKFDDVHKEKFRLACENSCQFGGICSGFSSKEGTASISETIGHNPTDDQIREGALCLQSAERR